MFVSRQNAAVKTLDKLLLDLDKDDFNSSVWKQIAISRIREIFGIDSLIEESINCIHFEIKFTSDKDRDLLNGKRKAKEILVKWKNEINLNGIPKRIEVIDTSNLTLYKLSVFLMKIPISDKIILFSIISGLVMISYNTGSIMSEYNLNQRITKLDSENNRLNEENKKYQASLKKKEEVNRIRIEELQIELTKLKKNKQ